MGSSFTGRVPMKKVRMPVVQFVASKSGAYGWMVENKDYRVYGNSVREAAQAFIDCIAFELKTTVLGHENGLVESKLRIDK